MQNVEFKAELRDHESARGQCRVLGATFIGTLEQIDTYYRMPDGRLKRRLAAGEPVEWIYYHRPDEAGARLSNYAILSEDQARRRWGTESLRVWLTVRKTRELWMIENVRIHLDEVEGLGRFIEFEAMINEDFDAAECRDEIAELREIFGPLLGEPISASYCDLVDQLRTERA